MLPAVDRGTFNCWCFNPPQAYGVQHATDMCKRILAAGIPGLHLYTLNLERSAIAILENLEIIPRVKTRSLPWRQPANGKRTGEGVRPVFWANRPAAYIKRTADWDQASPSIDRLITFAVFESALAVQTLEFMALL